MGATPGKINLVVNRLKSDSVEVIIYIAQIGRLTLGRTI